MAQSKQVNANFFFAFESQKAIGFENEKKKHFFFAEWLD